MPKFADRVAETTQTTGTGTLDLDGAITGHRAFAAALNSGDTVDFVIEDDPNAPTEWEEVKGTFTAGSPNTLSRDSVYQSSNGGAKISLQAGTTYTVSATITKAALGGTSPRQTKAANVASAATTNIWTDDGDALHVTGTTTITSFGTAPQAGATRRVIFDGALTLTNGANLILPTAANITTAAGDSIVVLAETTTQHRVIMYQRADGVPLANGKLVQIVKVQDGTVATGTTTTNQDNTIPQNTEGDQYMSATITPKSASSILVIDLVALLAHSAAGFAMQVALYQDATANALAAVVNSGAAANAISPIKLTHTMTAGTTSPIEFKVRAGAGAAGTTTFNGTAGGQYFGGVAASSIIIREYTP